VINVTFEKGNEQKKGTFCILTPRAVRNLASAEEPQKKGGLSSWSALAFKI